MKNLRIYLSSLLLVLGFGLMPFNMKAQDVKLNRQERKELEKAQMEANFNAIDTLLQRKTYVVEADFLQDQYGNRVPVTSVLNFILVDSPRVVIQTGSNYRRGYNGVGGVTAEGDMQNLKIEKNEKNLSYNVSFSVMTAVGIYDIFVRINSNGNATATISGLTGGKLTWDGRFQNLYNSDIYKGYQSY